MKVQWCALPAVGIALVLLSACNAILSPGVGERKIGVISFYDYAVVVELPDRVRPGEDFNVRVTTYGGGCIRQGSPETRVDGLRAEVTPYDIHSGDRVCTDDFRVFEHVARMRFGQAGEGTVVVRGWRVPESRIMTFQQAVVIE